VAGEVGCGAREVGYALAGAADNWGIPWWRVINSRGGISARRGGEGGGETRQRRKLLDEGVGFDSRGRVDFARFGWREASADFLAAEAWSPDSPDSPPDLPAVSPSPGAER